jgi:uncharacterized protein (DUF2345 family)
MAERQNQNWYQRFVESYGPNFRIDINNPQMGYGGTNVYDIYGVTDKAEKSSISLDNTGKLKIYSDRSLELVAGERNSQDGAEGVDIFLHTRSGDVVVTAEKNGNIRISGKNIVLNADNNLDLIAGNELNITSTNTMNMNSNCVDIKGQCGSAVPIELQWGPRIFEGSFVGLDFILGSFSLSFSVSL